MGKYRNVRTAGCDSRKEAKRHAVLKAMERTGLITRLEVQPRFQIIPKQEGERAAYYTADFSYFEGEEQIVEDVKSPATKKLKDYILRRKLMLQVYGIKIREV